MTREEKAKQLELELKKEEKREKVHRRIGLFLKIFFSLVALCTLLFLYMRYVATTGLEVHEMKIVKENLPPSFHGFKIIHFSDLHYGSTIHEKEIQTLTEKVNQLKPDLIVFTGDLIDKDTTIDTEALEALILALKSMNSTTKKYAIKGNHDYRDPHFEEVFQKAEFTILDNESDLLYYKGYTPILVTGIGSSIQGDADIDKAFSYFREETANQNIFTLALLHEPDLIDRERNGYKVDLAFAGHSHLGQVRIPGFGALGKIKGAKKYHDAYYQIEDTDLYVSGGLGTSTYKLRYFNRPSINFYRLVEK